MYNMCGTILVGFLSTSEHFVQLPHTGELSRLIRHNGRVASLEGTCRWEPVFDHCIRHFCFNITYLLVIINYGTNVPSTFDLRRSHDALTNQIRATLP